MIFKKVYACYKQIVKNVLLKYCGVTREKKDSLMGLKGLGKSLWENVDVQEYINDLRQEED